MIIKHVLLIAVLLWSTLAWGQGTSRNLILADTQPRQGEKINFTYLPAGTDLGNEKEVVAIAYEYVHNSIRSYDVLLNRHDSGWQGTLKPSKEALGLYLQFQNSYREDRYYKFDNNKGKGYSILLYNKRKQLIPGATLTTAVMLQEAQHHLKIKWDPEQALKLFEQEFRQEPNLKRPYILPYINALSEASEGESTPVLGALNWLAAQQDLTENEMLVLHNTYKRFGKPDRAAAYSLLMRKNWPQGEAVRAERIEHYRNGSSLTDKAELLRMLTEDFPEHDWQEEYVYLAKEYARAGNTAGFRQMLSEFPKSQNGEVYRGFVSLLVAHNESLPVAEEFAHKAYAYAVAELEKPSLEKPAALSEKAWYIQRENALGASAATCGQLFLKKEEHAKALPYLVEAYALTQGRMDSTVVEPYAEALLKEENYGLARALLETSTAEEGKKNAYKALYKDLYTHEMKSGAGFEKFWLARREALANDHMREQLQKQMIDEAAADFKLQDLDGKYVTLSSLKGKTVVIDFWATWSAPCLRAFRVMRDAITRYKGDDVVFLFVNSGEKVENKKKAVQDYKEKYYIPYQILMDENNTVAQKLYKVDSLPTKLVIDAAGNMRFKRAGPLYPESEALRELLLMIEMACSEL